MEKINGSEALERAIQLLARSMEAFPEDFTTWDRVILSAASKAASEVDEDSIDVKILKNTSINGHKVLKGSVVSVTEENAQKLISDGKAELKT